MKASNFGKKSTSQELKYVEMHAGLYTEALYGRISVYAFLYTGVI
jgi:hypothetical protein